MTKIINLFGAPGAGKSTLASGLLYHLKLKGLKVEISSEWIKEKLFEGTGYPFKDQLYTFAKQHKRIKQLYGKVDYIINDSPIFQSIIYQIDEPPIFTETVLAYFNQYENMNFFLERTHKYQNSGRHQTEEEAKEVGNNIEKALNDYKVEYIKIPTNQALEQILKVLESTWEKK